MSDDTVTSDLGDFGYRELAMAAKLLTAFVDQGWPDGNGGEGLRVWMNRNSGYVFLSDEDFNTAMLNGDKLELWLTCPECGEEGFRNDIDDTHHHFSADGALHHDFREECDECRTDDDD